MQAVSFYKILFRNLGPQEFILAFSYTKTSNTLVPQIYISFVFYVDFFICLCFNIFNVDSFLHISSLISQGPGLRFGSRED